MSKAFHISLLVAAAAVCLPTYGHSIRNGAVPEVGGGRPSAAVAGRRHGWAYTRVRRHLTLPRNECQEDTYEFWQARGGVAKKVIDLWHKVVPQGAIQSSWEGESCLVSHADPFDKQTKKLTVVHRGDAANCAPRELAYKTKATDWTRDFSDGIISEFRVTGAMARRNPFRTYVMVVPQENACSNHHLCSAVISLHGAGEHGAPGDSRALLELGKTGLLRMASLDADCMKTLRSILLFPQILEEESWVRHGPTLLEDFVLPLLRQVSEEHHVNKNHVGIVGYSEGAFGVMHAILFHRQLFSNYVAAAMSLESWANMTATVDAWRNMRLWSSVNSEPVFDDEGSQLDIRRLKIFTITLGEADLSARQEENLEGAVAMLRKADVFDQIDVNVRLLAGVSHNHWEKVFNNWNWFHETFWKGHL